MTGELTLVKKLGEDRHGWRSVTEQGERRARRFFAELGEGEREGVPSVATVVAVFVGRGEAGHKLGEKPCDKKLREVVADMAADSTEKPLAGVSDGSFNDGDAVLRETALSFLAESPPAVVVVREDAQDGVGGRVLRDHPTHEPVNRGELLAFTKPAKFDGAEARGSCRGSHLRWRHGDRRDAEAIKNNGATPSGSEDKTEHAATKSTARQRKSRSHREGSPDRDSVVER